MTQAEKRLYLINYLKNEDSRYRNLEIPNESSEQFNLFRSLVNVRMPEPISNEFIKIQDEYLQEEIRRKGITGIDDLTPIKDDIYLWQGDITTLKCDAIVNAANNALLGCFCPCHACIDNCIHTFAGVQLRLECNMIMQKQGHREKTGLAKITPAYNLPSKYVLHTVGPIIDDTLTAKDDVLLASCYISCLQKADEYNLKSIAFCCISTGEFHFPNKKAAEIAIQTVKNYKAKTNSRIKVIFNVFKKLDCKIYNDLLTVD